MFVRRCDCVNTAIFPDRFFDQQIRAIALGFGLKVIRKLTVEILLICMSRYSYATDLNQSYKPFAYRYSKSFEERPRVFGPFDSGSWRSGQWNVNIDGFSGTHLDLASNQRVQIQFRFLFHRFRDEYGGRVARFARSSGVYSSYSVFVLMTFGHMVVIIFSISRWLFGQFQPAASCTIAPFHVVTDDLRSTVADRCQPFDLDVVFVRVDTFWLSRLSRYD